MAPGPNNLQNRPLEECLDNNRFGAIARDARLKQPPENQSLYPLVSYRYRFAPESHLSRGRAFTETTDANQDLSCRSPYRPVNCSERLVG